MNLTELANNINNAFDRSRQLYETGIDTLTLAITSDKEAGEWLLKAKGSLSHGEFAQWVEKNCKFKLRHAQKLMQIAKNWEKIISSWDEAKSATRGAIESPLPSLRAAIALVAAEPKPEAPLAPPITKYKVALVGHECYGEVVEVKESLQHGDVLLCKTRQGEYPFLKKELAPETMEVALIDADIIEVEVTDNSEQLKEAIAIVIEYLSENELKAVLVASLSIGKQHLPSDTLTLAAKLIGSEIPALSASN